MRLVYYRDPYEVAFQYFWVDEKNQRRSPSFATEDEAKQWLIQSVANVVDEPIPAKEAKIEITDRYTEGFEAGKLFAELEYVELKQEILELIEDAKPSKLPEAMKRIKDLLK